MQNNDATGAAMFEEMTDEEIIAEIRRVRAEQQPCTEIEAAAVVFIHAMLTSPLRNMTKDLYDILMGGLHYMSTQGEVKREARRMKEQDFRKKRNNKK